MKNAKEPNNHKQYVYTKRIQFAIQDLNELRKNGWKKKVFKEKATKKEEFDVFGMDHALEGVKAVE